MNVKRCELVSRLSDDSGNPLFDIENMKLILASKNCIKDYSYIIHDKDIYTAEDEKTNASHISGSLKPAHIHLLLRFDNNNPQNTKFISKWFKIAEPFVGKIRGKWQDALLYLTHRNAPDKYQYSEDDVVANFNYKEVIDEYEEKANPLEEAIDGILNGRIREYNKTLEIDHKLLVFYSQKINEAFKVRQEWLQATVKERNTSVIFVTGKSGCGKTTLAKKIAISKGLAYFISSGSNDIMDGYRQEPVLILDDLRPSCLGLSDLLKMLDPYNTSSVKSRYKNKFLNCDIIIITTVLSIDTFYDNVFAEQEEPITQLKRRCGTYVRMDRETINISVWDDKLMRYTNEEEYRNNLLDDIIPKEKKTSEEIKDSITSLMPFLEKEEEIFHLEKLKKE